LLDTVIKVKSKIVWSEMVLQIFVGILFLVILIGLVIRLFKDYAGKTKTVMATLANKSDFSYEVVSKFGSSEKTNYTLTFEFEGITKEFSVSYFVYDSFEIGESGILKFKGNRYIDFQ